MTPKYAKDQPKGYNNYLKNVAVVGAGGQVGTYIVDAILKAGKHNVTGLTRAGSKSTLAAGVTKKEINYDDPSTIVEALKGQDILIITMAVTAPPGTHNKLVKAAADAGVPWVMPNEFGAGPNTQANQEALIGPPKQQERDFIDSLDSISWVGIASAFWYEWSLAGAGDRYGFNIEDGKREVTFFDGGEAKQCTTTWPRVGEAVAAVLALKVLPEDLNDKSTTLDSFRDQFVFIESFTASQKDMWASLMRVTGTKESDWTVKNTTSKERYETSMEQLKKGDRMAFSRVLYTRMMYPEQPLLWKKTANEALGLKTEDMDECTKRALQLVKDGVFVTYYA
jgi:hypothetical protein